MEAMRLFFEDASSPYPTLAAKEWKISEEEIGAVVTPYGKPMFMDEDSGIGMESDWGNNSLSCSVGKTADIQENLNGSFNEPQFQLHRRHKTTRRSSLADAKKSLFSGKRRAEDDVDDISPCIKKLRDINSQVEDFSLQSPANGIHSIIQAVDKLSTTDELVADGSRDYSLPTISGKHSDLKTISPHTMSDVIKGKYRETINKVTIIDCRYPYEFEGGHIKGAVNLFTKDSIQQLLTEPVTPEQTHVLIFHCEFSSERGPKMYRFLRSQDRDLNKDRYPKLNYPEVYLVEGGYKAFYHSHSECCDPNGYKPMLHEDHTEDLRHFRIKSKSWNGSKKANRPKFSRNRSCLAF